MNTYETTLISEWDKFIEIATKEINPGKSNENKPKRIFRGQRQRENKPLLKTSLERAFEYYPDYFSDRKDAEEKLLREFRRRYHQYSSDAPKNDDYLEWFSIMQHHGAPTRLLDFTYSIYIAAYFAFADNDEGPFEIYAIDLNWAVNQSENNNGFKKGEVTFFSRLINYDDDGLKDFKHFFIENRSVNFVCPINPFRLTQRLTLQKGIFMCPGNANATFEENLTALEGYNNKANIERFILKFDKDEIIKAKEYLYNLNITSATLFPGLEGFAESLSFHPPKFLNEIE